MYLSYKPIPIFPSSRQSLVKIKSFRSELITAISDVQTVKAQRANVCRIDTINKDTSQTIQ